MNILLTQTLNTVRQEEVRATYQRQALLNTLRRSTLHLSQEPKQPRPFFTEGRSS